MGRLSRLLPLVLGVVVLAACGDGSTAPPPELAELAVRLDDSRFGAGVPEATAEPGSAEGPDAAPASLVGAVVTIGATGGDGVSLRSACRVDARVAGGWTDGTELVVVEVGVDECDGWTRVEAAGVNSWVSNEYLPGLDDAAEARVDEESENASGESADAAAVRAWIGALDEASGRIALIARSAIGNSMQYEADFLRAIARDAGQLASAASAPVAAFSEACGGAALVLVGSAETLRIVAEQLTALFEGWPAVPYPPEVERLVSQYAAFVDEAGPMTAACLAPGES